jgi:hypothetical protein
VVTLALQALPNKDVAALIEQGVNVGVDAFLSGAVTIGIAARLTDEELSRTSLLRIVARRWWTIFAVDLVAWLIHAYTFSSIFGGPDDTGYGLFSLATVIIWGSLLYADVIASLDGQTPPAAVPGFSLLRSIGIALRLPNLLRTVLLSAMTLPATMLPLLLGDVLKAHGVPLYDFWANTPLDALLTGPYQALFTVFYLDVRARDERRA